MYYHRTNAKKQIAIIRNNSASQELISDDIYVYIGGNTNDKENVFPY